MQSANGWQRLLYEIKYSSERGHLIVAPFRKILLLGFVNWGVLAALVAGTTLWTGIVTIPLLGYWILRYTVFCKWWRGFRFSRLYLIGCPIAAVALAVLLRCLLAIYIF